MEVIFLLINNSYGRFIINEQGRKYNYNLLGWESQPFAFLATPEMKEKFESIYGKLEDIPVDPEVEKFKNMLGTALSEAEKGNFDKEKHFDELVRMFRKRGFS